MLRINPPTALLLLTDIVALKAGRSAVGQKATASHTGKIASPHAVYADVMEQAGIRASD